MNAGQRRWRFFRRSGTAASALDRAVLAGVILAGVGGVLIAYSDKINQPLVALGAGAAAIESSHMTFGQ